jgi:hypothetical protein
MAAELYDGLETYQKDETHAFMMTDSLVLLLIKVHLGYQTRANRERRILVSPYQCYRRRERCRKSQDDGQQVPLHCRCDYRNPPSFAHFHCAEKLPLKPYAQGEYARPQPNFGYCWL